MYLIIVNHYMPFDAEPDEDANFKNSIIIFYYYLTHFDSHTESSLCFCLAFT